MADQPRRIRYKGEVYTFTPGTTDDAVRAHLKQGTATKAPQAVTSAATLQPSQPSQPDRTELPFSRQRLSNTFGMPGQIATELGIGALKSAGGSLYGLAREASRIIPGVDTMPRERPEWLRPESRLEQIGEIGGDIAAFAVPGGAIGKLGKGLEVLTGASRGGRTMAAIGKMSMETGLAAGITELQGGDASDVGTAAALGAASVPGAAVYRGVKKFSTKMIPGVYTTPVESLVKAVKPGKNNSGFEKALETAVPDIKGASTAPIETIDDLVNGTLVAKKNIWTQYEQKVGVKPTQVDLDPVAKAIRDSLDERLSLLEPGSAERVIARGEKYSGIRMNAHRVEDWLQSANAELESYYAKFPHARYTAARGNPEVAAIVAEAEALRTALYGALDKAVGPGSSDLKRRYGALLNVEKEARGRQNVNKRQQPESLNQQITKARAAGDLAVGLVTGGLASRAGGLAQIAMADAIKARNSTDFLIKDAFSRWGTSSAAQQAARRARATKRPQMRRAVQAAPTILGGKDYEEPY